MGMTRWMLDIVMDGIKDTDMIAGYAESANKMAEKSDAARWFAERARMRLDRLENDWADVHEELTEHSKHDDELVDALACHVNRSIADLKMRIGKM